MSRSRSMHFLQSVRDFAEPHLRAGKEHGEIVDLWVKQQENPPEAQADGESAKPKSRREFLRGSLATGGLFAAGGMWLPRKPRGRRLPGAGQQASVAIVGAGLAGLTAAYRLKQNNVQFTLYEGGPFLGGRVQTLRGFFQQGQTVERGGESIDTAHSRLRSLVQELGLGLVDTFAFSVPGTNPIYHCQGSRLSYAELAWGLLLLYPRAQIDAWNAGWPITYFQSTPGARTLDQMSAYQWIETRIQGGHSSPFGCFFGEAMTALFGRDTADMSSLNAVFSIVGYPGAVASDERYRTREGNNTIAQIMGQSVANETRLSHGLVAAQTLPSGKTRLHFAAGGVVQQVDYDYVVFALPFRTLREADISQLQLSPAKRLAVEQLLMGTNTKLHMQFSDRHWFGHQWNGESVGDLDCNNSWESTVGQNGQNGILVQLTGGSKGASYNQQTADQYAQEFVNCFDPFAPGLSQKWIGSAALSYWTGSPLQRGSYSSLGVGQFTTLHGSQWLQEGNTLFAGEHTSKYHPGYMEGAVETGERAADEVLNLI